MAWELNGNAIGTTGAFLGTTDAQPLVIRTGATSSTTPLERLRVTTEGRVGIGITNPSARLTVASGGAFINNVAIGTNGLSVDYPDEQDTLGLATPSTSAVLRLQSPNGLTFHTGTPGSTAADNLRMTITPSGEVGVGKAPEANYKLDVAGTLNATDIHKNGAPISVSQWAEVAGGITYGGAGVGIGKAPSTSYKLDVAGTLNATDLHKNGSPLISSQWANVSSGISYTAGNVGVGKAPWRGYKLDVAGTLNATDFYKNGSPLVTSQWADDSLGISYAGRVGIGTTADRPSLAVGQTSVRRDESAIGIGAFAEGGGETVGIVAQADGAGTVYAGLFKGDVLVQGNLETPGGKAFLIDHPLDPENKTLRHNSVESPENLCLYRGKVKLGPNGRDTVRMPNYFAALINEDEATAYLTPVGEEPFPTSYKWNEAHTELTIFGTEGAEVAYLVLADRDDRTMHLFSRPVEEEKGGSNFERGKLLSPEAFDQPLERGVAPLPRQEEQTIRAEPIPPRAVPPEPIAPEMPAEDKGEGSH